MHDVFRGKDPWVVLCKKRGPDYNSAYSRFETASKTLTELAKFGVVDCSGSLPSGKSITQKFGLTVRGQYWRSAHLVTDALVLDVFRNKCGTRGLQSEGYACHGRDGLASVYLFFLSLFSMSRPSISRLSRFSMTSSRPTFHAGLVENANSVRGRSRNEAGPSVSQEHAERSLHAGVGNYRHNARGLAYYFDAFAGN